MFIEKTFHLHQSVEKAQDRLAAVSMYRKQLNGISKADFTSDGIAEFCLEPSLGCEVNVRLIKTEESTPTQLVFQSIGGKMEVAGMIEFFSVRDNLTEVVFTLDYRLKAPLLRVVDSLTGAMDRFVSDQLRSMIAHFEGVGTFVIHHPVPVSGHHFASAA